MLPTFLKKKKKIVESATYKKKNQLRSDFDNSLLFFVSFFTVLRFLNTLIERDRIHHIQSQWSQRRAIAILQRSVFYDNINSALIFLTCCNRKT